MFVCMGISAQTGSVSFQYDDDGNVKQRLVISVPAQVKSHHTQTDSVQVQVTDELGNQKVIIYPNPTKGQFQINITRLDFKAKNFYTIFSTTGSRLIYGELSDTMTGVDISQFPSGTYLLDIILGDKVSRWKVIKQ